MKCDQARSQVWLHAGGDLPSNEVMVLEEHLDGCASCTSTLAQARSDLARVHGLRGGCPPTLPRNFVDRVESAVRARTGSARRWSSPSRAWAMAAGVAAVVAGLLWVRPDERPTPTVPDVLGSSPLVSWEQLEGSLPGCLETPVRLDDWSIPDEAGVVAFLHRPDPRRPDIYVMAYCVEGSRLSAGRSYPWMRQRVRRMAAAVGSTDEIYVAVCPLPRADRLSREQVTRDLIRTFRPAFNDAGGV